LPRPAGLNRGSGLRLLLLDVLHLFLQFADFSLHADHGADGSQVPGLAAQGVDFAMHFLGEEIQSAAVGLAGVPQEALHLFQVAVKAYDFFVDVGPVGQEGDLLE